jgi:hypothetical protein
MPAFSTNTGEGGAKIQLTVVDNSTKATITHFTPETDRWTLLSTGSEIALEQTIEEVALDQLIGDVIRADGPRTIYCPKGWQLGESYQVEMEGHLAEGIYLTTTNVVGESKRHSLVLYFNGVNWFRAVTPNQVTLDIAEAIVSHLLVEPLLRTLRGIILPSGRVATREEVVKAVHLIRQRYREGATALLGLLNS